METARSLAIRLDHWGCNRYKVQQNLVVSSLLYRFRMLF